MKPLPLLTPILMVSTMLAAGLPAHGEAGAPIRLWPGKAPGDTQSLPAEQDISKASDGKVAGRTVIRLGNVSEPTITVYPAPAAKATGASVVVCPGGGYHILALDLEGTEVCEWLNSIGVTGVLLKYRVPARPDREKYAAPLEDAQRAIRLVRSRAVEWHLDPRRIGVLGFSAGGHLAATASTRFEQSTYPEVDTADKLSSRPDFAILVYPAYLTPEKAETTVSPELTIRPETSPTFLVMTEDDPVRVENVLTYTRALKQAKVPVEAHVYATGGHGYGLRPTDLPVTHWPTLVEGWMKSQGLLKK